MRSKGDRKKSIHFNGSKKTIELLLRTVISANPLSIYAAIEDLCDEGPKRIRGSRETCRAPQHLERWKFLPSSQRQKILPMHSSGETYGKNTSENSRSDAGLKPVEREHYFNTLEKQKNDNRCNTFAENTRYFAMKKEDPCERMAILEHNKSLLS